MMADVAATEDTRFAGRPSDNPGEDEPAIFIEDTLAPEQVRRLSTSPSAVAVLSPAKPGMSERSEELYHDTQTSIYVRGSSSNGSTTKKRPQNRPFAYDVTNHSGCKLFDNSQPGTPPSVASLASTPTKLQSLASAPHTPGQQQHQAQQQQRARFSSNSQQQHQQAAANPSAATVKMVPLAEYEKLEKEVRRYERMYQHQRSMAEAADTRHMETYQKLQDKIVEVVALSTRNEESKRFIRQLKREALESRTRTLDLHNERLLSQHAQQQRADERARHLLEAQREEFAERCADYEHRIASLSQLAHDMTQTRDCGKSLDSLLRASYTKSNKLFAELTHVRRDIERAFKQRDECNQALQALRREKREVEQHWAQDRQRFAQMEDDYFAEQRESQQLVLDLREELMEAMARAGSPSVEALDHDEDDRSYSCSVGTVSISPAPLDFNDVVDSVAPRDDSRSRSRSQSQQHRNVDERRATSEPAPKAPEGQQQEEEELAAYRPAMPPAPRVSPQMAERMHEPPRRTTRALAVPPASSV